VHSRAISSTTAKFHITNSFRLYCTVVTVCLLLYTLLAAPTYIGHKMFVSRKPTHAKLRTVNQ